MMSFLSVSIKGDSDLNVFSSRNILSVLIFAYFDYLPFTTFSQPGISPFFLFNFTIAKVVHHIFYSSAQSTKNISSDSRFSAVIHDHLIDDRPYKSFQDTEVKRKILNSQSSTIRMDLDTGTLTSRIKIKVFL